MPVTGFQGLMFTFLHAKSMKMSLISKEKNQIGLKELICHNSFRGEITVYVKWGKKCYYLAKTQDA